MEDAMTGADPELQGFVVVDARELAVVGCLFLSQMEESNVFLQFRSTDAGFCHEKSERFRLATPR